MGRCIVSLLPHVGRFIVHDKTVLTQLCIGHRVDKLFHCLIQMEDLTKQAKASRQNILDDIQRAHDEFLPLKTEVNELSLSVGAQPMEEPEDLPCSVTRR